MPMNTTSRFDPDDLEPAHHGATRVRYLIVFVVTLMAVALYLHRNCLSFAESAIKIDLGLHDYQIAQLLSAFYWAYALTQVPAGWLGDRLGVRLVLALYILIWSLMTGLLGMATGLVMLLVFRMGCGLAQAGAFPTSASLLSRWVPFSARGFASGCVSLGGRLGGAIAPLLTAYLLGAFQDWRPVMVIFGAGGVVIAVLFWLCFRERPQDHPLANLEEAELIAAGRPPEATRSEGPVGMLPIVAMIRSPSLCLSSLSQFTTNFGWVFLVTWMPRYLEEVHKVPLLERGTMTSLPLTLGMFGLLAGGWITDRLTRRVGLRWGRCLPLALTRFAAMAAFLACLWLDSPWAVTVALAMVALSVDLGTPSVWAYKQDVGGRYVGSVLGWGNMWGNIGAALSPQILERVFGKYGWDAVFQTCAVSFLLSGLVSLGIDARVPIVPPEKT